MGHVSVPWFIGGTAAVQSDKVARLLGHLAAGGREGVLNPLDCRVLALQTPGAGVRVTPGAYAIKLATRTYESYVGMIDEEDVVSTTATTSSGGRSDLVVFVVKNPTDSGEQWDIPADPANGPYVETEVITGVPAGTTSWKQLGLLGTAFAVARIDFPPSTATVTQTMLTDLRPGATNATPGTDPLATPPAAASQTIYRAYQSVGTSDLIPSNTTAREWPTGATFNIPVPSWATSFAYDIDVKSARLLNGNVVGNTWLKVGTYGYTTPTVFDLNYTGSQSTEQVSGGGSYALPTASRGTTVPFSFVAAMNASQPGTLRFTNGSYLKLWMYFKAGSVLE